LGPFVGRSWRLDHAELEQRGKVVSDGPVLRELALFNPEQ
jgi:hypothetical protein